MRQPPLSLIHSTINTTYSPSEEWRWSIEIPDNNNNKFQDGVYISRSSAPTGTRKWKRVVNDSLIVEFELNSHAMIDVNGGNAANFNMVHSVKLFMIDNYSQSQDEWIVTFMTKGVTAEQNRNAPTRHRNAPRSILSKTDFESVKWYWN